MALLHLIDVPGVLDDVEPLRALRSAEGPGPARDAFAAAIGRWIEAESSHPVVVLVADGPTRPPPVAGLITKRSEVEKELLKRLAHGWRRYRVISRQEAVEQAAKAAECELIQPAALWEELVETLGEDPLAEPAAAPAAEEPQPASEEEVVKKAAKKKVARKKAAKKAAKKKVTKKKTPRKATSEKTTAPASVEESPAPAEPAPQPEPEDELAGLDALVAKALDSNPPGPPKKKASASKPPPPPRKQGDLSADEVSEWKEYFDGEGKS